MEAADFAVHPHGPGVIWIHLYDEPTTWGLFEDPPVSERRLELTFQLTEDGRDVNPNPVAVSIRDPAGVLARDLNRYAWSKWLQVGWARARISWNHTAAGARHSAAVTDRVRREVRGLPAVRPGRRGHDESHYAKVAERYKQLVIEDGARDPGAQIAKEYDKSRNTVAGWIRIARQRGLLPPAHPGRAG
jgi:hypothetical protein